MRNISYSILGFFTGLFIQYYIKDLIDLSVLCVWFLCLALVISRRLAEIISFAVMLSSFIVYPMAWLHGVFNINHIITLVIAIAILYYSFSKQTEPVSVNLGDITRFNQSP